jgi:lipoate---protein ligase
MGRNTLFFPWKKSRRSTIPTKLHLLDLGHTPIFEQLQIEEALLRGSSLNVCIINRGSPRAIVMGISGKREELLNVEKVVQDKIPVIKRFSGGGTVIVDEETLFFTFIFNKDDVLHIHAFPEPILRWSGSLYQECFQIPDFHLVENDYVIGQRKCGGNAQYIKKDRWLHHTSFLWDYKQENMDYLLLPKKRPKYRENRNHLDFLCKLKEFAPSKEDLIQKVFTTLDNDFNLIEVKLKSLIWADHRKSVRWMND